MASSTECGLDFSGIVPLQGDHSAEHKRFNWEMRGFRDQSARGSLDGPKSRGLVEDYEFLWHCLSAYSLDNEDYHEEEQLPNSAMNVEDYTPCESICFHKGRCFLGPSPMLRMTLFFLSDIKDILLPCHRGSCSSAQERGPRSCLGLGFSKVGYKTLSGIYSFLSMTHLAISLYRLSQSLPSSLLCSCWYDYISWHISLYHIMWSDPLLMEERKT